LTLSLVFACRAAEVPTARHFVLAGVLAGLAVSSKYNVGLAVIPIGVAALYRGRGALSRLALAAWASAAAFALTSPYVLLRFGGFRSDMSFLEDFLYRSGDLALWDHLKLTFPHGLGWPLPSLLPRAQAPVFRRRPADVVLLSFAIPYLALISSVRITFPRYIVPLAPVLLVLASDLLERVPSRLRAIAFLFVIPPLLSSLAFDRIASRDDTRLQAAALISETLKPRTRLFVCRGYGAPAINTDRRRPPAFVVEEVDCLAERPLPQEAEFLVTHEHRELPFSRIPLSLARTLEERGEAIATFDPYRASRDEPVFFLSDAFYIPYAGLGAVERGGPVVRIWKLQPR
jgi:hypothetical protein